jgi:hypothetical protein
VQFFVDVPMGVVLRSPLETLKKQASQQAAEFDRLASKYSEATGSVSNKRAD